MALKKLTQVGGSTAKGIRSEITSKVAAHANNKSNPHGTTKVHIGLSNVPNFTATSSVSDASDQKFALAKGVKTAHDRAVSAEANAKAYTNQKVSELLGGAPAAALDTIKELGDALTDQNDAVGAITTTISNHTSNRSNPHGTTKVHIGLSNVPNYAFTSAVNDPSMTKFGAAGAIKQAYDLAASKMTQATADGRYLLKTAKAADSDKLDGLDSSAFMRSFIIEDGDGTEVSISNGKEIKFVEGGNIDINFTDTSTGSDADPFDLTFSVPNGSTSTRGVLQLSTAVNSTSTTLAATSSAVKQTYDLAASKMTQATADGRYLGKTAKAASAVTADKVGSILAANVFHTGHHPTWNEISGKPSLAASSHTHDDRYLKLIGGTAGAGQIPAGTDAQRPSGSNIAFRFNTQTKRPEFFDGTDWHDMMFGERMLAHVKTGNVWRSLVYFLCCNEQHIIYSYGSTTARTVRIETIEAQSIGYLQDLSKPSGAVNFGVEHGLGRDFAVVADKTRVFMYAFEGGKYVYKSAVTPSGEIRYMRVCGDYVFVETSDKRKKVYRRSTPSTLVADGTINDTDFLLGAVAMEGTTVVFGDPAYGDMWQGRGLVYVKSGSSWVRQGELHDPDGYGESSTGQSVALKDGVAYLRSGSNVSSGYVHIYKRSGSSWSFSESLDTWTHGNDGSGSVGFIGDSLIVSAWNDNGAGDSSILQYDKNKQGKWEMTHMLDYTDESGSGNDIGSYLVFNSKQAFSVERNSSGTVRIFEKAYSLLN